MKTGIIAIVILSLLAVIDRQAHADAFVIKISYLEGEKSKDSWLRQRDYNIDGGSFSYSMSYDGHRTKGEKSESKSCILSDTKISDLQKFLDENNLFVNDSLFDKDEKYSSFERFVNLAITVSYAEKVGRIRINGDISGFKEKDLYKRALRLVDYLEGILSNDCK